MTRDKTHLMQEVEARMLASTERSQPIQAWITELVPLQGLTGTAQVMGITKTTLINWMYRLGLESRVVVTGREQAGHE